MTKTASLPALPKTAASEIEEMTATVLMIGEWLVKQQQQLKQQQRRLEEKQRQIEAQQKQIEQLNEQLDKLKNRSSQNSSVPPSSDQLKKPSDSRFLKGAWLKCSAGFRRAWSQVINSG
jgi:septal ring factor EnvC (AmiA/AmiB activator)